MMSAAEQDICIPSMVSIECSCLSTDGYEVENLVSDNPVKREQGFVGFSFVKPPVSITFNFKNDQPSINTIVIGLNVGQQMCTGLHIFTETKQRSYKRNMQKQDFFKWNKLAEFEANDSYYPNFIVFSHLDLEQEVCRVAKEFMIDVRKLSIRITKVKTSGPPCLASVNIYCPVYLKIYLKMSAFYQYNCDWFKCRTADVYGFAHFTETKQRSYKRNMQKQDFFKWNKLAEFEANDSYYPNFIVFSHLDLEQEFCRVAKEFMIDVRKLSIRITKVKTSGPPCLASVNIYCPVDILKSEHHSEHLSMPVLGCSTESVLEGDVEVAWTNMASPGTVFPNEFVDKITQEIMSKPFLLPSGENVDESTLHKLIEVAQSQGKLPYDPFSYQEFSSLNYPVENIALRDRIRNYNRELRLQKLKILTGK
ncbi:RING finger protein 37-like [Convolutriloba macropyga]|uniref:RING finger protein 37-like n=1 Tax=Convolutriloba macropyga TaxID=536237 RepID=UPI003F5279C0